MGHRGCLRSIQHTKTSTDAEEHHRRHGCALNAVCCRSSPSLAWRTMRPPGRTTARIHRRMRRPAHTRPTRAVRCVRTTPRLHAHAVRDPDSTPPGEPPHPPYLPQSGSRSRDPGSPGTHAHLRIACILHPLSARSKPKSFAHRDLMARPQHVTLPAGTRHPRPRECFSWAAGYETSDRATEAFGTPDASQNRVETVGRPRSLAARTHITRTTRIRRDCVRGDGVWEEPHQRRSKGLLRTYRRLMSQAIPVVEVVRIYSCGTDKARIHAQISARLISAPSVLRAS